MKAIHIVLRRHVHSEPRGNETWSSLRAAAKASAGSAEQRIWSFPSSTWVSYLVDHHSSLLLPPTKMLLLEWLGVKYFTLLNIYGFNSHISGFNPWTSLVLSLTAAPKGVSAKSVTLHWAGTLWANNKPKCIISKVAQCIHSVFCIQTKSMARFLPHAPLSMPESTGCLHPSYHCWWGSVLMQTIHKAFPLQIRCYPELSEIFLSQWAIKIITFNHILQLLHSTEGGLGGLGPDANIFCCD